MATKGDELKIVIDQAENVGIGYGIGVNYAKAVGGRIQDPKKSNRITVQYPNSLWLSVFNTGEVGNYKITYYYLKRAVTANNMNPENLPDVAFSIEDRVQEQNSFYTWSLIIGSILLLLLIVGGYLLYRNFRKEKQLHENALENKDAISWGLKRDF